MVGGWVHEGGCKVGIDAGDGDDDGDDHGHVTKRWRDKMTMMT